MAHIVILSSHDFNSDIATVYTKQTLPEKISCDILLCLSNFDPKGILINCNYAIVYGDLGFHSYQNITYNKIITYGMSSKNTVTISSILNDDILIALLRDITSFSNKKISICEFLKKKNSLPILDTLAFSVLNLINH